ncbi:MAG TPA: APC family permease [Xanthomonadaceae bacterium]
MAASTDSPSSGYRQELKRSLTVADLLVYGLVFISPTAPIAVFGIVFDTSRGMVPLVYLVGLFAMVFTAMSYMAMSRVHPVAGSVYTYTLRTIGPTAGFLVGWALLLDYLLMPTLAYVAAAIALHAAFPVVPAWLSVVGMLAISTLVNYLGIETTARVNILMLAVQVLVLLVFAIAAMAGVAHGVAGAHYATTPFFNPAVARPSLILAALSLGVLSFLGFDAISTLAEEARDGPRTIARATMLSLCLAAALFVAQTYLASLFVPGRTAFANDDAANAAFYDIAQTIGGYWLKFLVAIPGIVIGAAASALTAQAATARLLYSMARDRKLPAALAHVHPQRKVPERAVLLVAAVTLVLGVTLVSQLELLTSMVCFGALVGFMAVNLAVIAPGIGLLIAACVLWNAEANAKIAGGSWLVVGIVYLLVLRMRGRATGLPVEKP